MKKNICILSFVLLFFYSHAQELLNPQPQATFITRFPFRQYSGGVITVKAALNNIKDSLNFILDTGSGGISLDSTTCANISLKLTPSDTTITGMGGTHKVSFAYNQELHLPGLTLDKLNFHVNDYEILSGVYGEKIDGIIGYSFFSRYIVKLNFDKKEVEVYTPGEISYPKGGSTLRPAFTTLPIVSLNIRDARRKNFNFYFDTGGGLCFLMSESFAKDSGILLSRRKLVTTQAEGMGGRLRMQLTVIKQVQIGHFKFKKVPTFIYNDLYNVTSYPFVGGLIGNDLLRRFNIILNYPKREIHLLPNNSFNDPFDYAYTGMAIYYVDGKIVIDDVIENSPATKAGLQKGDIIVGVENNLSGNINEYKNILQTTNQKIKVIVIRKGQVNEFFIKPKNILK
ncbi:aspartyl protease family protein [Ferruginibacter sp. SUN002]|uniref:aspartyl protease family protein n=1 Tax=Ferruginibacter sp. SUN002 TaxID=2937789 RepID=UPI003D363A95